MVVMETVAPVAVSAIATDVPWRFIGQFIIIDIPGVGVAGLGSVCVLCSPVADNIAGANISNIKTLFTTPPSNDTLFTFKHVILHDQRVDAAIERYN